MKKRIKILNMAIAISIGMILTLLAVHCASIYRDNHKVYSTIGNDNSRPVYMDIDFRGDSTSRWQKKDFDLYGDIVDMTGTTIDETLYNNTNYSLKGWTLRININGECFINQAWNGQMEIHQNVGNEHETVQKLNLQNYKLEDIRLEYLYDGDLLIPLHPGDYVVYYPSETLKENTVARNGELTVGVIFYFLDSIDLSDYELNYTYHREFTQGYLFYIILLLCFALFTGAVAACSTMATYKAAQKEQDQQKMAISCMSDIYQIIYLINLETDELSPVYADASSEKLRPKGKGAREQIAGMFVWDAEDNYQEIMQEFSNLDTVGERLRDRNSIACEYVSRHYGWCSIRIFGMDSEDGKVPQKVLFTIQVIDDEKREFEHIKVRASKADSAKKVQNVILSRISDEMRDPLSRVADNSASLLAGCEDSNAIGFAEKINSNSKLLLAMVDGIFDYSDIQAGMLELKSEPYSLKQTISEAFSIAETATANAGIAINLQISEEIPDRICGDDARLKQALIHLISHVAKCTPKGRIKISMYGKTVEDHVHLLISVVGEGVILTEKTAEPSSYDADMDLCIAAGIIERMDSQLKVISGNEETYEFYFEIDQDLG